MTKEEYVDKIGILNKNIQNFEGMLSNMKKINLETTYNYIKSNKKYSQDERVKVYSLKEGKEVFIGNGYIKDIFSDPSDGLIVYSLFKEENKKKTSDILFDFSVDEEDKSETDNIFIRKI